MVTANFKAPQLLSIVIPARNEAECISSMIEHLHLELSLQSVPHEIIVVDDGSNDNSKEIINKFKDKLKKYRTRGLEDGGEFSNENLVFKVLRRNGYIQKLFDFQTKHADKNLSLKERYYFNK